MKRRYKNARDRGKVKLSLMFQKLEVGDRVAIIKDLAEKGGFPKRIQGRTGIITGRRGNAYIIDLKEFNAEKQYIIKPIHLKKLEAAMEKKK